jgi:hypothetical protein
MLSVLALCFVGLLLVNCWTIIRFWQNKVRAQAGDRRIPEADLLGLALMAARQARSLLGVCFDTRRGRSLSRLICCLLPPFKWVPLLA